VSREPQPALPLPAADVRAARVGDEMVLLQLEHGVYFSLNATGAWIWERLATGATRDELCAGIVARFEVESAVARRDLDELLVELERAGLVEADPAGARKD
jgi:hypothetical protein